MKLLAVPDVDFNPNIKKTITLLSVTLTITFQPENFFDMY